MKDTLQGPAEVSKVVWEGREARIKDVEENRNSQGDQEGQMWSGAVGRPLMVGTLTGRGGGIVRGRCWGGKHQLGCEGL